MRSTAQVVSARDRTPRISSGAVIAGGIALVGAGGALGIWGTKLGARKRVDQAKQAVDAEVASRVSKIEARMASEERREAAQSNIALTVSIANEKDSRIADAEMVNAQAKQAAATARQEEVARHQVEVEALKASYEKDIRDKEESLRQEYDAKVSSLEAQVKASSLPPENTPGDEPLSSAQKLEKAESEFSGALQVVAEERDKELTVIKEKYEPEILEARRAAEEATATLSQAANDPSGSLEGQLREVTYREGQLREAQTAYQSEVDAVQKKYTGRLQQMIDESVPEGGPQIATGESSPSGPSTASVVKGLQNRHRQELDELRTSHQKEIDQFTAQQDEAKQKEIAALEKSHNERLSAIQAETIDLDQEKSKIQAQMKAKYDQEIAKARSDISRKYEAETQKRVRQAKAQAAQQATEKLVQERMAASNAAKEEIRVASLPKPRRAGELAFDSDGSVSLEGSQRNGLQLSDTATLGRRIDRAASSMASKHSVELMDALNGDFKEEVKKWEKTNYDESDGWKWKRVDDAMGVQNDRETALQLGINEVAKRTRDRYRAALEAMGDDYSDESIRAFDEQSKAIAATAKREAGRLLKAIRDIQFTIDARSPRR